MMIGLEYIKTYKKYESMLYKNCPDDTEPLSEEEITDLCCKVRDLFSDQEGGPELYREVVNQIYFLIKIGKITKEQNLRLLSEGLGPLLDLERSCVALSFFRLVLNKNGIYERTGVGSYARMEEVYNFDEIIRFSEKNTDRRVLGNRILLLECADVVRLRKEYFVNEITRPLLKAAHQEGKKVIIEDISCGSGRYLEGVLRMLKSENIEPGEVIDYCVMYDNDKKALDFARDLHSKYEIRFEIRYQSQNLIKFRPENKAHIKISGGLVDYFPNSVKNLEESLLFLQEELDAQSDDKFDMIFKNIEEIKEYPDDIYEKINSLKSKLDSLLSDIPKSSPIVRSINRQKKHLTLLLEAFIVRNYNSLAVGGVMVLGMVVRFDELAAYDRVNGFTEGQKTVLTEMFGREFINDFLKQELSDIQIENFLEMIRSHKDRAIMEWMLNWNLAGMQGEGQIRNTLARIGVPENEIEIDFLPEGVDRPTQMLLIVRKESDLTLIDPEKERLEE